jgi:hypothetical protein
MPRAVFLATVRPGSLLGGGLTVASVGGDGNQVAAIRTTTSNAGSDGPRSRRGPLLPRSVRVTSSCTNLRRCTCMPTRQKQHRLGRQPLSKRPWEAILRRRGLSTGDHLIPCCVCDTLTCFRGRSDDAGTLPIENKPSLRGVPGRTPFVDGPRGTVGGRLQHDLPRTTDPLLNESMQP